MTSIKTLLIPITLGLGVIALLSCSSNKDGNNGPKTAPVKVTVATPLDGSIRGILASGQVEAVQTVQISTRVMGFISSIPVKVGDKVSKGQLLVSINNQDIVAKKGQAEAMLSEAEAALKSAQRDYERFTNLYNQHSASAKEMDNITLQYNSAKARVEAAKQMRNEAGVMLSYTNLTAPFSGVVTQKMADAGSMASPGMPILTIEQSGSYQVNAIVPETDVTKLKAGANATITIKSAGRTFESHITQIDPSSQGSGGQYQIKVAIPDNEKNGLYSGMYVNVLIPVKSAETKDVSGNAILVPASALVNKEQLTGLFTVSESHTAILRWVRLGKVYGSQVEVLAGLDKAEKYIASADGKLYNGVPVVITK